MPYRREGWTSLQYERLRSRHTTTALPRSESGWPRREASAAWGSNEARSRGVQATRAPRRRRAPPLQIQKATSASATTTLTGVRMRGGENKEPAVDVSIHSDRERSSIAQPNQQQHYNNHICLRQRLYVFNRGRTRSPAHNCCFFSPQQPPSNTRI